MPKSESMGTPKVTVYITAYNYGRFISQAVDSVLKQTMTDWELIIIDDGSTDNTQAVLEPYRNHPGIMIIQQENKGLNISNNIAIRLSRADYVMRLDADDYLDENCLLVLSYLLDTKAEVGLVYSDYYHVDSQGEILELVRRKKIGEEVELLDLPAHGACTMIRKSVLINIGSYDEAFTCQDGYDLWLKLIQQYNPYNVNVPLFYYRRHPHNLTHQHAKVIDTRYEITRNFIEKNSHIKVPRTLGLIPILSSSVYQQNRPFVSLRGRPLLWYTLSEAAKAKSLCQVIVASDDDDTLAYTREHFPTFLAFKRTGRFSSSNSNTNDLVKEIFKSQPQIDAAQIQAICLLYISTPLRKAAHIDRAVDTMAIFNVDSVLSIQEELAPCYHHERYGLMPINGASRMARLERKAIYKENGAVYLHRVKVIEAEKSMGNQVGHITMLPEESVKINSDYEFWLAEQLLAKRHTEEGTTPEQPLELYTYVTPREESSK